MRTRFVLSTAALLAACASGDSARDSASRAHATVGPVTGDSAVVDTIGTTRPPAKSSTPSTPSTGSPPSRGDGRLENPPIHRTNPRDEDDQLLSRILYQYGGWFHQFHQTIL